MQGAKPPSWEDLYIHNRILVRVFDTIYVKELRFELTVVLLQRLAALSLGGLDFLLECSQDHFTSNTPWRHVEDENKEVMDGSIPYYVLTFLAWVHKHKEKGLHAAFVDFPSMHFYAHHPLMEELTWEGITLNVYQHMERCIAYKMKKMLAQPLPYSLAARENLHLSHFSSMTEVHDG